MKRIIIAVFSVLILVSCNDSSSKKAEEENAVVKTDTVGKKFEMYEMSEMAMLMEQMYVDNELLKERIATGDTIGNFPQHFLKIHESVMTDEDENDAFFKEQAQKFIEAQALIYRDSVNAKKHFNDAVSACIKCHEVKCGGPIPRIKKLYIN